MPSPDQYPENNPQESELIRKLFESIPCSTPEREKELVPDGD